MTTALEAHALSHRYRARWAIRDCFLAIPEGSVVGLVGPNGAGKTTLLKVAAGLIHPTEGRVTVFGTTFPATYPGALDRVRYLAQEHPLYPSFTVGEMLELGRRLNRRWDRSYAESRVASLGVDPRSRIRALSGGQRAQVSLTLAIASRADLLLLDEPLASLDPHARKSVMQMLMESVAEHGLTVIISSHILADLERVANQLVLLNAGRTQVNGAVDELLPRHSVLVGPVSELKAVTARRSVVSVETTPRQATLLVRDPGPTPSGWAEAPATLEEIVLGYMSNPGQSTLPPPAMVAS